MDPKLLTSLDKVLEDVVDMLCESGWEDEAAWYDDIRRALLSLDPSSRQFTEVLVELDQSFRGLGSLVDIPLGPTFAGAVDEVSRISAIDVHHQRLGLVSCASGIVHHMKKTIS
jgi:hypothetical protein